MNFKLLYQTKAGWGMLFMRVVTGVIFIGHGAPKFGWGSDRSIGALAEWLGSIGIPLPSIAAFLVAGFETFGGAFLIIGLLTRFWSAGLAFAMLMAVALVHWEAGMFAEHGYQWALLLLACSLTLMVEGAGKLSVDAKLSS